MPTTFGSKNVNGSGNDKFSLSQSPFKCMRPKIYAVRTFPNALGLFSEHSYQEVEKEYPLSESESEPDEVMDVDILKKDDEFSLSQSPFKCMQPKISAVRTFPNALGLLPEHSYQQVEKEYPLSESESEPDEVMDVDILKKDDDYVIKGTFDVDVLIIDAEPKNDKRFAASIDLDLRIRSGVLQAVKESELVDDQWKNSQYVDLVGLELCIGREKSSEKGVDSNCKAIPPRRKVYCERFFPPNCGDDSKVQTGVKENIQVPILQKCTALGISSSIAKERMFADAKAGTRMVTEISLLEGEGGVQITNENESKRENKQLPFAATQNRTVAKQKNITNRATRDELKKKMGHEYMDDKKSEIPTPAQVINNRNSQNQEVLKAYESEAERKRRQLPIITKRNCTILKPKGTEKDAHDELKKETGHQYADDKSSKIPISAPTIKNQSSQNLSKRVVVLGLMAEENCPGRQSRLKMKRRS